MLCADACHYSDPCHPPWVLHEARTMEAASIGRSSPLSYHGLGALHDGLSLTFSMWNVSGVQCTGLLTAKGDGGRSWCRVAFFTPPAARTLVLPQHCITLAFGCARELTEKGQNLRSSC